MSEPTIVKRMKDVIARAEQLNRMMVVTGVPNEGKSHDSATNAEIGLWMEFGVPSKNIPERSTLRSTASEEAGNLGKLSNTQIAKCLRGEISARDAYSVVGAYFQGKIIDKITDGDFTPNTPETIRRKGSSKPLIDEGDFRASITYEVRERES